MAKLKEFIQTRKPRVKVVGLSLNEDDHALMLELCEKYDCSKTDLVVALMKAEMA